MNDKQHERWQNVIIQVVVMICIVAILAIVFVSIADAQTPPISTVSAPADTIYGRDVFLTVEVSSDIPCSEAVGIYWTTAILEGWNYAGATRDTLTWQAPMDDTLYLFSSQVNDDDGNPEEYHQIKAEVFTCMDCIPPEDCPECPGPTVLGSAQHLASEGILTWGTASEPRLNWHWAHPDSGTTPIKYEAEWDVGGVVSFIDSVAVGDTTFAEIDLPYTWGTFQLIRVRAVDIAGRIGIWSIWSERWDDAGPPGQPPQPQGTLKMTK